MFWIISIGVGVLLSTPAPLAVTPTAYGQATDQQTVPLVIPPRAIHMPSPKYPEKLAKTHPKGSVLVWIVVDEKGRPSEVSIKASSGNDVLDQAALEGVKKWKFKPATSNGKPVKVKLDAQVNFTD